MNKPDGVAEQKRYIVPGLRRGLAVLRLFNQDRRVIAVPEMVRALGISRASAFRLAYTLEMDGYLRRVPHSDAFELGLNVLSLGFEYLGSLDLLEIARPILEDLRDRTDASAHLGVRDGTEVIYLLKAPSRHRLRSNVSIGSRMPAHATSVGRVLLFDLPDAEVRRLYRGLKLQRFTAQTPATVEQLIARLDAERRKGYVSYRSAYAPGIASVAAPVRDAGGAIVAGVNVSDSESLPALRQGTNAAREEVLRAAALISRGLGYRPQGTLPARGGP